MVQPINQISILGLAFSLVLSFSACSSGPRSDESALESLDGLESLEDEWMSAAEEGPASDDLPLDALENLNENEDSSWGDMAQDPEPYDDPVLGEVADPSTFEAMNSPDPSMAGSGSTTSHTVLAGDTLMKLAFEYYGDIYRWKDIYQANLSVISNVDQLPLGATLQIELPGFSPSVSRNGEPYLIQAGDTLGKISNKIYGTPSKWPRLQQNNPELIKDPDRIYAGFTLYYIFSQEDEQERSQGVNPISGLSQAESNNS